MARMIQGVVFSVKHWVIRSSTLAVLASISGVAAAFLRPHMHWGMHWEAIISFFILLPGMCLWSVLTHFRVPYRKAIIPMQLEILVIWGVFAVCLAITFQLQVNRIFGDFFQMTLLFWIISAAIGAALLGVIRLIWKPTLHFGPYCPGCSYCLIGAMGNLCPECGRGFTMQELGITREDLQIEQPT